MGNIAEHTILSANSYASSLDIWTRPISNCGDSCGARPTSNRAQRYFGNPVENENFSRRDLPATRVLFTNVTVTDLWGYIRCEAGDFEESLARLVLFGFISVIQLNDVLILLRANERWLNDGGERVNVRVRLERPFMDIHPYGVNTKWFTRSWGIIGI